MNLKTILKAIGYAVLTLLLINLIYFIIELNTKDIIDNWKIAYKHGTFAINGNNVGLSITDEKAIGIMLIPFLYTLYNGYKSDELTLKKND